ncbi:MULTISPECIES: hypothetical protein [unclassified Bradyrhizobium]|uniref:hypothetical protein n=1 Tax=unclassified Bradyrhizobium TaxID=2631580 RepID=UPI000429B74E|nr:MULTISPECIES: hypothetical protein [unclassified Bradyrhizobium]QIG98572.1 hypothetical protein G6P99_44550 [Bradyrhizobium sp. 6(2017)]
MATTDEAVTGVRALHHSLIARGETYRKLICATPDSNVEGAVAYDEFMAMHIMREIAAVTGFSSIAVLKLADLQEALHTVLLSDGLDGSIEAAQRHVATVKEQSQRDEYESTASRRAFNKLPPLNS